MGFLTVFKYFLLPQVLANMEDIKVREIQIFDYRKKIAESETKLKQQQNLYEAVRSDRNLYSKNLVEAQVSVFVSLPGRYSGKQCVWCVLTWWKLG